MTDTGDGPFRIVVVGGGISGLAFAHGIERAKREGNIENVEVVVFEKRAEDSSYQKYPIRVSPEGREALKALLTPRDHEKLLSRCGHGIRHGGITGFTQQLSHLFSVRKYVGEMPQYVHRWVLNDALREGVDVRRGRTVVRVRNARAHGGAEKIEVVFDDGVTERADLVIGADGVGSILRGQLHPTFARTPILPYVVVQFKILAPLSDAGKRFDHHGVNLITGTKAYSMILVPFHGSPVPPLPTQHHDPFSDPEDFRPTLEALDEACPEYVLCCFALKDAGLWEDMTGPAWLRRIAKILEDDQADPKIIYMIENKSIPQTVGAWQIASADEKNLVPWRDGRIVLIGDAAHALPPQGGIGGSLALKDAQHLLDTLLSSTEMGVIDDPLDSLLPIFHRDMMQRAAGHIQDAKRRLSLSNKEGWAVYWQRLLLRIINLCVPLADWVLSRGRKISTPGNDGAKSKSV